jgi:hypothetical protein
MSAVSIDRFPSVFTSAVLKELITYKRIVHDFDDDEAYILSIVAFLKDVGWMKEEQDGSYSTTNKAKFQGI